MLSYFKNFLSYQETAIPQLSTKVIPRYIYLSRDKSNKYSIDILPNSNSTDISFYIIGHKPPLLPPLEPLSSSEYRFILKDPSDNFNEILLPHNFPFYNIILQNPKHEIFYLKIDPSNINFENSLSNYLIYKSQYEKTKYDNNYQIDQFSSRYVIKEHNNLLKFGINDNKFHKIGLCLDNDLLLITKFEKNKKKIIPIKNIVSFSQTQEIVYNENNKTFLTLMIETRIKKHYFIFRDVDDFSDWFIAISKQFSLYKPIEKSNELSKELFDNGQNKNSLLMKISSIISKLDGVLSIDFCRKIFLDLCNDEDIDKEIKNILDDICKYKEKICEMNYFDAWILFEEIYRLIEKNTLLLNEIKLDDNYKNKTNKIRNECKNIVSKIQNDNNEIKSNFVKQKKLNESLDSIIDSKIFDSIYKQIIERFLSKKYNAILNDKDYIFAEKINWTLANIEQNLNKFDNNNLFDVEECIKDLIIPLE